MINLYRNLKQKISRRETIFVFSFLVLLLFAAPTPTFAFWERIVASLTALPALLITAILMVGVWISGFFVQIVTYLLEFVISPNFISISYTRPCTAPYSPPGPGSPSNCNPIIGLGLDTTQQFVNMLLVIILVYIALSIALRTGERNAQSLFWKIILVALLVNFAPVFVGIVVDAANIIMNYFLSGLQGGFSQIGNQLSPIWDSISKELGKTFSFSMDPQASFGLLGRAVALLTFNTVITFVLWLFLGVFFVRYIAIWIIVILAPLAFVFGILPQTNNLYRMWEKQLVQWSFIGVPMAFFMYLGVSGLTTFSSFSVKPAGGTIDDQTAGLLTEMYPYFTVIIFLIIGLFISISASAMGSKAVLSNTRKFGEWAGKKSWDKTKRLRSDTISAGKDVLDKGGFYKKQFDTAIKSGKGIGAAFKEARAETWKKKTVAGQKAENIMASTEAKTRISDLMTKGLSYDEAKEQVGKWADRQGSKQAAAERRARVLKVTKDHAAAAGKGVGGAMIDMIQFGWYKTFGEKPKKRKKRKKGSRICPNPECKKKISASAKTCPHCGEDLEEFEPDKG